MPDAHAGGRRPRGPRLERAGGPILTIYRCGDCWIPALDETRAAVASGDPRVAPSFCEFLTRQGYGDAGRLLEGSPEQTRGYLLAILDAVQDGKVVFHP